MHPLNDVREGEELVKRVYEAIRASHFWADTLLIVTFDEHGGFYDHVPPPPAVPTGDDQRYNDPANQFNFDRLGVRVPTIVASPFTQKNTVIGQTPQDLLRPHVHTVHAGEALCLSIAHPPRQRGAHPRRRTESRRAPHVV